MTKWTLMLTGFFSLWAHAQAPIDQLNLQTNQVTISGLSSGAFMAGQYHLAHAEQVSGVAMLAGGPYYCAQGNLGQAISACLHKEDAPIDLAAIDRTIKDYQSRGLLASDSEIQKAKIWIFHGDNDQTVGRHVAEHLVKQYQQWFDQDNLTVQFDEDASHHFPTMDQGHACDVSISPFIGACQFDAAGALLKATVGQLNAPSTSAQGKIYPIKQHKLGGATATSIAKKGYIYIPDTCLDGEPCSMHVSFHGCKQNAKTIGMQYVEQTGFNRWADTNRMVVLYPQTKNSLALPFNPHGCWDWWGYTDARYATREGQQIKSIHTIINTLGARSQPN